jgi:hypothetical protein
MTFIDTARREAAELKRRQSELDNRYVDQLVPRPDPAALAEIAERYDPAYRSLSVGRSPAPMPNESAHSYRRRLASGLARFSEAWRDVNLYSADRAVIDAAEPQILADAAAHVRDLTIGNPDGSLREVPEVSAGGHQVTNFGGSPASWLSAFARPAQFVRRFQTPQGTSIRVGRRSI